MLIVTCWFPQTSEPRNYKGCGVLVLRVVQWALLVIIHIAWIWVWGWEGAQQTSEGLSEWLAAHLQGNPNAFSSLHLKERSLQSVRLTYRATVAPGLGLCSSVGSWGILITGLGMGWHGQGAPREQVLPLPHLAASPWQRFEVSTLRAAVITGNVLAIHRALRMRACSFCSLTLVQMKVIW